MLICLCQAAWGENYSSFVGFRRMTVDPMSGYDCLERARLHTSGSFCLYFSIFSVLNICCFVFYNVATCLQFNIVAFADVQKNASTASQSKKRYFGRVNRRTLVTQIEFVVLRYLVNHFWNFPQILVVVIYGYQKFRVVVFYVIDGTH